MKRELAVRQDRDDYGLPGSGRSCRAAKVLYTNKEQMGVEVALGVLL